MKRLFSADNYACDHFPSQGIYQFINDESDENQIGYQIVEAIRKQSEWADSIQGIQVIMGTAGGAGSGLGAFTSEYLKSNFSKQIAFTNIVMPTALTCRTPLDFYNTALLFPHLKGSLTFAFDNEAVQNTCFNTFFNQMPDNNSINELISKAILGTTQSLRYPGKINTSFIKIASSLLPLYQLNIITMNLAPLLNSCESLEQLCSQLFTDEQQFFTFKPSQGKYITCQLTFKGSTSIPELDQAIYSIQPRDTFVNWIFDNIQKTFCTEGGEISAQLMSNSTAVNVPLKKLADELKYLNEKYNYAHLYENSGIEKMDLEDSTNYLYNLHQEYLENDTFINSNNDQVDENGGC